MNLRTLHETLGHLLDVGVDGELPMVASTDIDNLVRGIKLGNTLSEREEQILAAKTKCEPGGIYGLDIADIDYADYSNGSRITLPRQIDNNPVSVSGKAVRLIFAARANPTERTL